VSVETDGVMALVEIEAGAHRITAAITGDAVEELGLREGDHVFARIQATNVMVELNDDAPTVSAGAARSRP
jgi:molybdopterin-binding protein